jgi:hypothetical protein
VSNLSQRITDEQRALRSYTLFETFRENLLNLYFPREQLVQLHSDPLVDCWSDANLVTATLRTLLPLGHYLTQPQLNHFVDEDLPCIKNAAREQLWYWHLSGNTNGLNEPLARIVITPDEDFFWLEIGTGYITRTG